LIAESVDDLALESAANRRGIDISFEPKHDVAALPIITESDAAERTTRIRTRCDRRVSPERGVVLMTML
jgi:hypothetical protein